MTKNYLVTGGSGYLGSVLSKKLLELGNKVRIIDLFKPDFTHNNFEFILFDITKMNYENSKNIFKDIDVVHHNAATLPIENDDNKFFEVNEKGTKNVIEFSVKNNVKAFVYMSSAAIFAKVNIEIINEQTQPIPLEKYGQTKYNGELVLEKYKDMINISIIRPRTVLGGERYGIFQLIFEWVHKNYRIPVINHGDFKFQFIHCNDLVDFSIIAENITGYNIFNVGTDQICTIKELMEGLIKHSKSKSKILFLPKITYQLINFLSYLKLSPINTWHSSALSKTQFYDITKATNETDWKPKFDNISTINESYDSYIKNRKNILLKKHGSVHSKKLKKGILYLFEFFLRF